MIHLVEVKIYAAFNGATRRLVESVGGVIDPVLILTDPPFSFLVKGLFFPSGPFSLIDARSFLLLA